LKEHIRTSTNEKSFSCSDTGYKSIQSEQNNIFQP